ncbi:HAMP domain-containing sensor histidine kinase [Sulfitobacter sp.]|uniref:sensor histidine kinase n=1 Tax=Sulfitobacter sp. TaxID=1903071 RepID=UPI003296F618
MQDLRKYWAARGDWFSSRGREERIKDYIALANQLVWKRQVSLLAAAVLAALYLDAFTIFTYYAVVAISEMLDLYLGYKAKDWDGKNPVMGGRILKRIVLNTAVSGVAISAFTISIAVQQPAVGHFLPLFFLFSAAVFAAMYNSQMMGVLVLRLSIYALAFLYIACLDVMRYLPPLSSPIWLEFFTTIFVLYFICDISMKFYSNYQDRLRQMKLLRDENERTKAALEVKSQFLATVSHELRTPLTSIIGSLELIKADKRQILPDGLKPVIGIAARNGQRLAALIEDLLDLQKLEAGEMAFHFQPLDANELVSEAVDSTAGYAGKLGIEVTTAFCPESCRIAGDHNRLIQVMSNLLSNALKFSHDGGAVHVRVEVINSRVRIAVQDNGVGIPEGAEECVFGKFSQVDSSDVRKVGGTGLGLNITKQIIERHNSTINYVSKLGVGSTFYVEFDRLTAGDGSDNVTDSLAKAA